MNDKLEHINRRRIDEVYDLRQQVHHLRNQSKLIASLTGRVVYVWHEGKWEVGKLTGYTPHTQAHLRDQGWLRAAVQLFKDRSMAYRNPTHLHLEPPDHTCRQCLGERYDWQMSTDTLCELCHMEGVNEEPDPYREADDNEDEHKWRRKS